MIGSILLLFFAGAAMIVAEFILPGAVVGAIGFLLLIASGAIGIHYYPEQAPFIVVAEIAGLMLSIFSGFLLLRYSPARKLLALDTTQRIEDGYINQASDTTLLGQTGVAKTVLRPAGTIEINGRRLDAVSDGSYIEQDALVRVVEVQGNRVVVEKQ